MKSNRPLADRMRPKTLDEFLGQEHLVGEKAILRKAIESKNVPSMILWGPPGVGKTTLAYLTANELELPFYSLSAIQSGVKEVRKVIDLAEKQRGAILFIDEIHRFHKGQQDALLGAVEKGIITLIGATTENPSFEVNSPLLSRCQVYILRSLEKEILQKLVYRALEQDEVLNSRDIHIKEWSALLQLSGGDARKILNLVELAVNQYKMNKIELNDEQVMKVAQEKIALYDKSGEQHYDLVSAFIKSMRGSDPNAAVYYLARMLEGGEDPKFLARRLVILASEDVGNANPTALVLATNCFHAIDVIGMPEARIILSQTAVYLAASPKSNATYNAINKSQKLVKQTGDLPVPLAIRNAPTNLMKEEGYGKGYKYAHSFPGNFAEMEFLPDEIRNTKLFDPGDNARENDMRQRLRKLWKGKYDY